MPQRGALWERNPKPIFGSGESVWEGASARSKPKGKVYLGRWALWARFTLRKARYREPFLGKGWGILGNVRVVKKSCEVSKKFES